MFSRQDFIESVRMEANILKHLYTKLPKDRLDYRPTPNQRSLGELLEYLPANFGLITQRVIRGDWQTFGDDVAVLKEAVRKDFVAALDGEVARMERLVAEIPEADLTNKGVTLPNGLTMKLGVALVSWNLKFMAAYRMQFFLYLKACGKTELVSRNLWMGQDPQPKK